MKSRIRMIILFAAALVLFLNGCDTEKNIESPSPTIMTEEGEWQHGEQNFFQEDN